MNLDGKISCEEAASLEKAIAFDAKTGPAEEQVFWMRSILDMGALEASNLWSYVDARLLYLAEQQAEMTAEDQAMFDFTIENFTPITDVLCPAESAPTKGQLVWAQMIVDRDLLRKTKLCSCIERRFQYLAGHKEEAIDTDDQLFELVVKNFDPKKKDKTTENAYIAAFQYVWEIFLPFMHKQMRYLKTPYDMKEDCLSAVKAALWQDMHIYDHTKGKIVTAFRNTVIGALSTERNGGATKYSTSMASKVLRAKDALIAQKQDPNAANIARHINTSDPYYKTVSEAQVQNALDACHFTANIDDCLGISDDTQNPEQAYITKERSELLIHACDQAHQYVKALYDIYLDFFLSNDHDPDLELMAGIDEESMLSRNPNMEDDPTPGGGMRLPEQEEGAPAAEGILCEINAAEQKKTEAKKKKNDKINTEYLRWKMKEKTGIDFSKSRIESLQQGIKDIMTRKGLGPEKQTVGARSCVESVMGDPVMFSSMEEDILYSDRQEAVREYWEMKLVM